MYLTPKIPLFSFSLATVVRSVPLPVCIQVIYAWWFWPSCRPWWWMVLLVSFIVVNCDPLPKTTRKLLSTQRLLNFLSEGFSRAVQWVGMSRALSCFSPLLSYPSACQMIWSHCELGTCPWKLPASCRGRCTWRLNPTPFSFPGVFLLQRNFLLPSASGPSSSPSRLYECSSSALVWSTVLLAPFLASIYFRTWEEDRARWGGQWNRNENGWLGCPK